MEIPKATTYDRTASISEVSLVRRWFTEAQGRQLQSQWAEVPNLPSYLVVGQVQRQETDNPQGKDSESNSHVLLLDLSARCDA